MEKLAKVVQKIANYGPWQKEGLTEEEFKVLDKASGIEIAEIAYNNQINFNRFLMNADVMINMHNDQVIWTQMKEVKTLKCSLVNQQPFTRQRAKKVSRGIKIAAEDVQTHEANTNIVNIAENPPQQSIELPNIEQPAQTVSEKPDTQTFVSNLLCQTDPFAKSIPMHREAMRPTDNITIDQNIDRNEPNILPNLDDEVPMINEAEIAKLGFFDGDHGRKISKIIHQKEQNDLSNIALRDMQAVSEEMLPQDEDIQVPQIEEPLLTVERPRLKTNQDQIEQQMEDLHVSKINQQQKLTEDVPNAPLAEDIPIPEITQPTNVESQTLQFFQRRVSSTNERDSMTERFESFKKAVEAANELLGKAKRRKRPQRPQRQQREQENIEDEIIILNPRKETQCHAKKRSRARRVKLPNLCSADLNFFGDIDIYTSHDIPFEDHQELETSPQPPSRPSDSAMEFDLPTSHHRVLTSTPMLPKKRTLVSPEAHLPSSPKRLKSMDSIEAIRNIQPEISVELDTDPGFTIPNAPAMSLQESNILAPIMEIPEPAPHVSMPSLMDIPMVQPDPITVPTIPQDQIQPSLAIPQIRINVPAQEMSTDDQSLAQARRQSRKAVLQNLHISAESVDFDRLRRNSRLRKTPIDSRSQLLPNEIFQNACENLSEREAVRMRESQANISDHNRNIPDEAEIPDRVDVENEILRPPPPTFEDFPRVFMNGENYIVLESDDGSRKAYYTENHLNCITLYLKIRFLMAQVKGNGPWKMKLKELFGHLKDLKDSRVQIYHRILHMTQIGLFEGTFNENNKLLDVEIPLNRYGNECNDQENVLP